MSPATEQFGAGRQAERIIVMKLSVPQPPCFKRADEPQGSGPPHTQASDSDQLIKHTSWQLPE